MNNAIKLAHIQRNANLDAFEDQYCDNCLNWNFNGATFKYHDNTYKSSKYLISKGLDIRNSKGEYIFSKSTKLSFSLLQECINDICEKYINSYCSKKYLFFIFGRIGHNSEWSKKIISNVIILLRIGWKRKKKMN